MTDRIGQRLGNYHITRLLGRGGFAEVYLGEHIYLKTPAAVKILHTRLSGQEDLDGFLREAQLIARLIHPNIVRVMDFGIEGDTPFLVMDYASHGTLRQRHPKGTRLPLSTIVPYVKDLAAALQHAHEERLVHRDIKPENMLLGRRNEVLLSDFGIALIAQSSRYQSTQDVVGTVAYMSPEQIQGKPRPASDQYSLGIVVYEWLTGDRPFHGSFTELCTQHMFAPVPSLREKIPDIAPQVEQVVAIALAKDVKQRFGSIQAFATALEQASQSTEPTALISRPEPYPATPLAKPVKTEQAAPTQQVTPPLSRPLTQPAVTPPATPREPIPERQLSIPSPIISPFTVEKLTLLSTLTGHTRPVASIAISADGQTLASGSYDKTIKVWDLSTGQEVRTLTGHRDSIRSVAFSASGQIVVSGSYDNTIKVWDLSTSHEVRTLTDHKESVYSVALSADGKTLISGSRDKTIKVWDLSTDQEVRTLKGHRDSVYGVALSADGLTVVSASWDKTIKVWDLSTGREMHTFKGHRDSVNNIALSTDGQIVVSGSYDKTIKVWDLSTGREVRTLKGHRDPVYSVAISGDGRTLVSGSGDKTIKLWNLSTGREMRTLTGHNDLVYCVAISADGLTLVSGSGDKTIKVWRA